MATLIRRDRTTALLVALFVLADIYVVASRAWLGGNFFGLDARIYYRAAEAWLAGGDPWAAGVEVGRGITFHFAGLPPTVLLTAPFTVLPETVVVVLWTLAAIAAAVWTLRRFDLPLAFLLFPPTMHGIVTANPQAILVPLVLLAPAVAPLVKVYAVFPIAGEGRWRALVVGASLAAGMVLLAPDLWREYLTRMGEISARLLQEGSFGWGAPAGALPLAIVVIGILAIVDRRAAGWLAPVIAWPSSQWHYATFALPLASPILLALLAVPIRGWPLVAVAIWTGWLLWQRVATRRRSTAGTS